MSTVTQLNPDQKGDRTQAQERFNKIRGLVRVAEANRIQAAVLLAGAADAEEWLVLDLPDFTSYCQHIGLPQSTGSKMLKVGRVFGDMLANLSPDKLAELSIERLYIAAQMVDQGMPVSDALDNAIAHPTEWLLAQRDGTEPLDKTPITCPHCGTTVLHHCSAPADPDGSTGGF
jgi:hypothetical protein